MAAFTATPAQPTRRAVFYEGDDRFILASRYFLQSGFASVSDLADAIYQANPQVDDWTLLAEGSIVLIPTTRPS